MQEYTPLAAAIPDAKLTIINVKFISVINPKTRDKKAVNNHKTSPDEITKPTIMGPAAAGAAYKKVELGSIEPNLEAKEVSVKNIKIFKINLAG